MKVRYAGILLLLAFVASSGWAKGKGTAATLPKNPKALLQMAWQANGLHGPNMKPWHVLATWQELDAQGKPEKQGTFEEWWAGPDKVRMEMNGLGFHQTRWVTAKGDFSAGDKGLPAWVYKLVAESIVSPVPDEQELKNIPAERTSEKVGSVSLQCARAGWLKYCLSNVPPVLRIEATPVTEATFNGVVRFQGRYVARDIHVVRTDMPNIAVHVEKIETLEGASSADFMPAAGATEAMPWEFQSVIRITLQVVSGGLRRNPKDPRGQYVQGTVILSGVIEKNGSFDHLEVIGGPAALQLYALNTLKAVPDKPYLVDGKPVAALADICFVHQVSH
jgi:hypothetical protein